MPKASANRPSGTKRFRERLSPTGRTHVFRSGRSSEVIAGAVSARIKAVMRAARQSGLLADKSGRIGGRVSPALIQQAKRQTGIESDTDLIEFALATVALEDNFAEAFKKARGKVDPDVEMGF